MPLASALSVGAGGAGGGRPLPLPPSTSTTHHPHVNAFQHTQLGVYLSGAAVLVYVLGDVLPTLLDAHHLARTWLWLLGLLGGSAYLYARPFIRGLGSAHRCVSWCMGFRSHAGGAAASSGRSRSLFPGARDT